jgi:hypothetical protein
VLHRPDLADDHRYATNAQRCELRSEPVLRELGYDDAEVNAMRAAGAI